MFSTRIATQIYAKICFETTPGQKKIIEKLSEYLADDDFSRIFVLNGYAGTGKTTLIAGLVGALKDLGIKPVLLAPTGRAAKVLAQYAQEKALTIHKRIYRQRTNADYESKFSLNINPERGAVFIVDEASMLSDNTQGGAVFGSGSLLSDLVEYVRSGRGCRLVLVGDSAQLPPVGADFSPALDPVSMDAYGGIVYGTMDEVVRQEAQSGILFNATLVRCMLENGLYEIPRFEMDFPDIEAVVGGEFLEKLQDCYARYGRDETIVITRSNKRANRYNEGIRRNVLYAEEEIESGDMLMVVKNNYYFPEHTEDCPMNFIANGDIARLKRLRRFDRERIEAFCRERGIALYDTAVEVIRLKDNASDASLQVVREVDLETLLARIPACRAVVTTGQKATDTLRAITGCGEPAVGECVPMPFAGRDLTLWRMPSSSRAFPRPVEWKAEFYRKVFSENGIL